MNRNVYKDEECMEVLWETRAKKQEKLWVDWEALDGRGKWELVVSCPKFRRPITDQGLRDAFHGLKGQLDQPHHLNKYTVLYCRVRHALKRVESLFFPFHPLQCCSKKWQRYFRYNCTFQEIFTVWCRLRTMKRCIHRRGKHSQIIFFNICKSLKYLELISSVLMKPSIQAGG